MAPERVFLHIGAPKTGTTYLQALLAANRRALKDDGILYPRFASDAHHTAAWDLRGTPAQRKDVRGIDGAWRKLVDKANSWDGKAVVISSELFVYCDQAQIRTALSAFAAEVYVVYTARDLLRQVPAVWQERVKNQQTISYRNFVQSVMRSKAEGDHAFWRAQDAAAVMQRWSRGVDPARVFVVTAPPAGEPPTVLWHRFVSVLRKSGDSYSSETTGPTNRSLGIVQTELLRRYNARHGDQLPWPTYRRTIRGELDTSFAAAISDPRTLTLADPERAFFTAAAHEITERVRAAGYSVVGDLADLLPAAESTRGAEESLVEPADLTDGELLDAALDVLHVVLTRQQEQRKEPRGQRRRATKSPKRRQRAAADQSPGRPSESAE